jgi:aspartate aminotransferase
MISKIVSNIIPSGTVAINSKVLELIDQGERIINLSVGEPDFDTPEPIKKAAFNAMMANKTKYDKVPGLVELRKAICDKLKNQNDLNYTIDEIVVSSGAKQCITNICFTVLNDGDEVIIPTPYWVTYPEIVKIARGVPVFAKTSRDNDFKITAEDIEKYATDKTKMLVLCNPSNPLGTVHTREELQAILDVCLKRNIYILADEVYERICFDDDFVSIASLSEKAHDYILIINALSKAGPMTGWRIGYTASNREFAEAMQ